LFQLNGKLLLLFCQLFDFIPQTFYSHKNFLKCCRRTATLWAVVKDFRQSFPQTCLAKNDSNLPGKSFKRPTTVTQKRATAYFFTAFSWILMPLCLIFTLCETYSAFSSKYPFELKTRDVSISLGWRTLRRGYLEPLKGNKSHGSCWLFLLFLKGRQRSIVSFFISGTVNS
jgi:hypothetical protein